MRTDEVQAAFRGPAPPPELTPAALEIVFRNVANGYWSPKRYLCELLKMARRFDKPRRWAAQEFYFRLKRWPTHIEGWDWTAERGERPRRGYF